MCANSQKNHYIKVVQAAQTKVTGVPRAEDTVLHAGQNKNYYRNCRESQNDYVRCKESQKR
jgi:hypothetical protein